MKKSICIVSPSTNMGGIERALVLLANTFIEKDYKVDFISCLAGEHFYELRREICLIEPNFKRLPGLNSRLIFYPRLCLFIRRTIISKNPDAILSFGDWFNPIVLLSLLGLRYPVFISDRTSPDRYGFPLEQVKTILYPRSTGFIAQTKRAADFKHKKFGQKLNIKVIPNALREVSLYSNISREKIILYVGRFAWEKAPELLIRAYKAIPDRQGWQLHMAGTGPLLKSMKALVADLNIKDEVVFHGKIQDIDSMFARAGIYVLPSVIEGFPNSLCEAMAAGLPCICFDSIPYEEIFTNGVDGIAIDSGDLDKLTSAMIELMNDKQLRETLGTRAKQIRNRLSVDIIGKQFTEFIFGE